MENEYHHVLPALPYSLILPSELVPTALYKLLSAVSTSRTWKELNDVLFVSRTNIEYWALIFTLLLLA